MTLDELIAWAKANAVPTDAEMLISSTDEDTGAEALGVLYEPSTKRLLLSWKPQPTMGQYFGHLDATAKAHFGHRIQLQGRQRFCLDCKVPLPERTLVYPRDERWRGNEPAPDFRYRFEKPKD